MKNQGDVTILNGASERCFALFEKNNYQIIAIQDKLDSRSILVRLFDARFRRLRFKNISSR